ncbi:hypothetical protein [Actinacidiphila acidipaludis]|uniref:Chromosome partitioning protein n=1 Tax=Actinacidiphila acidipaludis TaxID=2873382 RepID=A0ABS7QEI0_9ACTN|nr:hypothetical protein [Streptomyces acidipaludis]MBY8881572.1 hypothetical protein [Streptomyces acidipaludis]
MTGIEIAVGYVFAYLVRKAKRVAGQVDAEVARGLDAGMDRLHDLVSAKLGPDPALERATEEAWAGQAEPSERTQRRLADSLEDAAERDPDFAKALQELVEQVQAAEKAAAPGGVSASGSAQAIGGNATISAEGGSAAALRMGDVTIGSGTVDPHRPGPEQS